MGAACVVCDGPILGGPDVFTYAIAISLPSTRSGRSGLEAAWVRSHHSCRVHGESMVMKWSMSTSIHGRSGSCVQVVLQLQVKRQIWSPVQDETEQTKHTVTAQYADCA